MEIIKIFKSKKECIVGYRPEMILLRGIGKYENENRMFRLLPEGLYVDNESFKPNFENKYTIKKISLDDIEDLVEGMSFSLSTETKAILRNGLQIQNHIKEIYEKGIEKMQI